MALHAGDARVCAKQWERSRIVIEEHAATPAAFVMTLVAPGALPAAVHIVVPVTCVAGRAEVLVVRVTVVARGASDLFMPSTEGELRAAVVLERVTSPFARRVAGLAGAPELPVVRFVALVAPLACGRRTFGGKPVPVTLLARGAGVLAR